MENNFRFKQFSIRQNDSAMKVGTDGVLLGSWVTINGDETKILDVGTGTGLIALMVAQRCKDAIIDAVEIEPMAAKEAQHNAQESPFKERVRIFEAKFQDFATKYQQDCQEKYDLIVSNPPYFNGTYKSTQVERTAARHAELLNSDDLITGVLKVIDRKNGRFVAIFPYEVGAIFIAKAAVAGLYCNKILNVYPKKGRYIKRILAEFSMTKVPLKQNDLAIEEAGDTCAICYTDQYKELTNDFYIKF